MKNFEKFGCFDLNNFEVFILHIVPPKNGIENYTNCHRGLLCPFVWR